MITPGRCQSTGFAGPTAPGQLSRALLFSTLYTSGIARSGARPRFKSLAAPTSHTANPSARQRALVHRGLPDGQPAVEEDTPKARVDRRVHSVPVLLPRPEVVGSRRDVIDETDLRRLEVRDAADLLASAVGQARVRRRGDAEVVVILGPDRPV